MKHISLILVMLLVLGSCKQRRRGVEVPNKNFHIPVVVQPATKDTIEFVNSDFLNSAYFKYVGKYKFTDTIKFATQEVIDTTYGNDILEEYHRPHKNDSLSTDGFQLFADYGTSIYNRVRYSKKGYYCFPLYVVNETSRTKVFIAKDSHALGLQEAADTSRYDTWTPIECRGFDFCGNGYFGMKVHPGEFVMLLIPKYEGNEKSEMRIRLQVGETIYLSQVYEGTFNRKQFFLKKDSWTYNDLKKGNAADMQWTFYGAIPKEYRDKK
jgi:hypothetical protein